MLSTVRRSSKFNKGLALSVSLPNVLAKNINRTVWFCFTWIFFICVLYTLPHAKILLKYKTSSFLINSSIFRKHVCQMPSVLPRSSLMPRSRAAIKLRMPHPRNWQREQNRPGWPGRMGTAGIDWCITPGFLRAVHFSFGFLRMVFLVLENEC